MIKFVVYQIFHPSSIMSILENFDPEQRKSISTLNFGSEAILGLAYLMIGTLMNLNWKILFLYEAIIYIVAAYFYL